MPNEAQTQYILDKLGVDLSPEQRQIIFCPNRFRLVAGGERSGKSFIGSQDLLVHLPESKLMWLVAADYERTRAEFNYICEGLEKLAFPFVASKQIDPGEIDVIDAKTNTIIIRITTKSAKDPRKLAMEAPDYILVCEASQIDYETHLRLRGRLAEKRGKLLETGTFESSLGWYPETFLRGQVTNEEGLKSFSLPTWSNLHIFPGGRNDPEIKMQENSLPADWFQERFGGVPCPPKGLVFNEFRTVIHTGADKEYQFDPAGTATLFVDPGYASIYAILVAQQRGENLYIVDEVFERGLVTEDIIRLCKQKPWWNRVSGGVIDIEGTRHMAMAAPTEVWLKEGGIYMRSNKVLIKDGIERTKTFLTVNPLTGSSRLHINSKCSGLISELGGCPNPVTGQTAVYKWHTDKEGNVTAEVPEDKNNHAVKALAYGLVDLYGYSSARKKHPTITFF